MCRRKGDDENVIRRASEIIARLGYMKIVLKSDEENSMNEVDHQVRENLQQIRDCIAHSINVGGIGQVVIINSAVCEAAADGNVETESSGSSQSGQVGCRNQHTSPAPSGASCMAVVDRACCEDDSDVSHQQLRRAHAYSEDSRTCSDYPKSALRRAGPVQDSEDCQDRQDRAEMAPRGVVGHGRVVG